MLNRFLLARREGYALWDSFRYALNRYAEQQLEDRTYLLLAPDASLPDDPMSTFEPFRSINVAGRWYHIFEIT